MVVAGSGSDSWRAVDAARVPLVITGLASALAQMIVGDVGMSRWMMGNPASVLELPAGNQGPRYSFDAFRAQGVDVNPGVFPCHVGLWLFLLRALMVGPWRGSALPLVLSSVAPPLPLGPWLTSDDGRI